MKESTYRFLLVQTSLWQGALWPVRSKADLDVKYLANWPSAFSLTIADMIVHGTRSTLKWLFCNGERAEPGSVIFENYIDFSDRITSEWLVWTQGHWKALTKRNQPRVIVNWLFIDWGEDTVLQHLKKSSALFCPWLYLCNSENMQTVS